MDALETFVRAVQSIFNELNEPQPAIVFAFGHSEREQMQGLPAVAWDEPDGDILSEPDRSTPAPDDTIGRMVARCIVVGWFTDRESARNACMLIVAAARDVDTEYGSANFDRYEIAPGNRKGEVGTLGFQFQMQCRVSLPIAKQPPQASTEVEVQGHEFTVKAVTKQSTGEPPTVPVEETVATGSRPTP